MSVQELENKRWENNNQRVVFRHKEALKMVGRGNVLDIGCGDGLFLSMLKNNEVEGVDVSNEGLKKCVEKGLKVSLCDFSKDKLPFSDDKFDNVIILDVLEHLYFPGPLLEEAKRVSKKNIIISVPNFNSLPARLQILFGKVPENNVANKGHIYWFNLNILKKMLEDNGLKIVDLRMNTFWRLNFFTKIFPSLFALSFVLRVEKGVV